jgi:hypothetical protein
MRFYRIGKVCFGVGLAIMMSLGISYADNLENDFNKGLISLSKDNYTASRSVTDDAKSVVTSLAYGKDTDAIDFFKKMLVKNVSTASDIDNAVMLLAAYGHSVSNAAEKSAFNQALKLLEERVKYLAYTEKPKLASKLEIFPELRKEFKEYHKDISNINKSVAASPAVRSNQTRATSSNKNKTKKSTTSAKPATRVKREISNAKLGARVADGKTTFAVYSPEATEVKLYLFQNAADKQGNAVPMKKD